MTAVTAPRAERRALSVEQRRQLTCLNAFWPFLVLFGAGWFVLAGFVPPPRPSESATQIADQFRGNTTGIRVGMVICIFASALIIPWGGAICGQLRRLDSGAGAVVWAWAIAQACLVIEFMYPGAFWAVAAFRTGSDARVQSFNDLAWLPFLGIVSTVVFQAAAMAYLTLTDTRERPVYPRWFGYFQAWCAVGVVPGGMIYMFKTGPLAWNGLLAFWVSIVAGFAWMTLTTVMTARAIRGDVPTRAEAPHSGAIDQRLTALETMLDDLTRPAH